MDDASMLERKLATERAAREQAEKQLAECLEYIEYRKAKFSPQRTLTTCEHGEQNWLDRLCADKPPKIMVELAALKLKLEVAVNSLTQLKAENATLRNAAEQVGFKLFGSRIAWAISTWKSFFRK